MRDAWYYLKASRERILSHLTSQNLDDSDESSERAEVPIIM
jgi:hypothetical protein